MTTLAAGATGSSIVLSGNDEVFDVLTGIVEFSTDSGTTWLPITGGNRVVFSDGLTVIPKNGRDAEESVFTHMPI